MQFNKTTSINMHNSNNVSAVMLRVLLALLPGTLIYAYFFGWNILLNITIACITAVISEALMLYLRKRPIKPYMKDYSAILTACLLALALPTLAPWWLIVIATLFAIIIAKHLYGGLGYNPFNPAMVGYVVVMISFPQYMTQWLIPHNGLDLMQTLQLQLWGITPESIILDSITSATPIDSIKTGLSLQRPITEIGQSPLFGTLGGIGWEWITTGFFAGGLWLIYKRTIGWQIPVAMLSTIAAMSLVFNFISPELYAGPLLHLFNGGTVLAAFFIATDPVSASTTPKGRIIYAIGIGLLTYIIRTWGGYPDGIAFAVLLMNMAVPTIDYYTQPRIFGANR
ncbi:MAG: electron transport complex subunit RsxD [Gammaproteobacteria bacterium]|nr:electron transport complex subunit RsxD [Gammaproteobacteria bacterium]